MNTINVDCKEELLKQLRTMLHLTTVERSEKMKKVFELRFPFPLPSALKVHVYDLYINKMKTYAKIMNDAIDLIQLDFEAFEKGNVRVYKLHGYPEQVKRLVLENRDDNVCFNLDTYTGYVEVYENGCCLFQVVVSEFIQDKHFIEYPGYLHTLDSDSIKDMMRFGLKSE